MERIDESPTSAPTCTQECGSPHVCNGLLIGKIDGCRGNTACPQLFAFLSSRMFLRKQEEDQDGAARCPFVCRFNLLGRRIVRPYRSRARCSRLGSGSVQVTSLGPRGRMRDRDGTRGSRGWRRVPGPPSPVSGHSGSGPVDYGRIGQFKPRERVLAWVGGERTIRLAVFFVLSGLEKESPHWLLPLV